MAVHLGVVQGRALPETRDLKLPAAHGDFRFGGVGDFEKLFGLDARSVSRHIEATNADGTDIEHGDAAVAEVVDVGDERIAKVVVAAVGAVVVGEICLPMECKIRAVAGK